MSAPLPTGGAPLEVQTWHELEDVFAQLSQLARSPIAPHDFYRTVLDQSVRALSAEGGAVWLRASGAFQIAAQTGHPLSSSGNSEQAQQSRQAMLLEVADDGHVVTLGPQTAFKNSGVTNSTDHVVVFGPVKSVPTHSQPRTENCTIA